MKRSLSFFWASVPVLLVVACSTASSDEPSTPPPVTTTPPPATPADETPPEPQCRAASALPDTPWFTDITASSGLADIQAYRATAGDIDGDGLPDLVLHAGGITRDSAAKPMKWVFHNAGGGRFEDVTAASGLFDSRDGAGTGRMSHLSVLADVDNDGDLDVFDGAYLDANVIDPLAKKDRSEIFLNDGKGHFTFADRSGPSKPARPMSGASFTDIDRDGIVDLFVGTFYFGNEGAGNFLFKGNGDGTFADISQISGVLRPADATPAQWLAGQNRKPAYGVTTCDADDDGNPDLVVSSYGRSYNELWHNDGNGHFTEIGQGTPFAADDRVDYEAGNEFYHCWCAEPANAGKCTEEDSKPKIQCDRYSWEPGFDDQPAREGGNNFTTACADLDNDGDMDFVHATIRHWHIGDSSDPSQIVRNDLANGKSTFVRVPNDDRGLLQPHGIPDWNEGNMDVAAFDIDNDGRKDIFLASSDYPDTWALIYRQRDDGGFENVTAKTGIHHYHAHGFAAVDIDGDGDLDLIVTTSPARCEGDKNCPAKATVKVYRNDIGSARNFVKLRLHGKGAGFSNAAGIGAKVTVVSGGVRQTQEVSGGYGHFGLQHDTVLTFGLGATCGIDAVEVRWPNGEKTVQRFEHVVPNHLVDLFEGEAKPKYTR